jgi:hypothetical protein
MDPSNPFPGQEEHYQHHEYCLRQDPIGAVRGVFSLFVYSAVSRHRHRENRRPEHKSQSNTRYAHHFGKARYSWTILRPQETP